MRTDILNRHNTTDREKILHNILYYLTFDNTKFLDQIKEYSFVNVTYETPEVVQLVIGNCGEIGILRSVSEGNYSENWTIQILGTDKLENWENESFKPIIGMPESSLLYGKERKFQELLVKTINRNTDGVHLFSNIKFQKEKAIVTFRKRYTMPVETYDLTFNWKKIKSQKECFEELKKVGWLGNFED